MAAVDRNNVAATSVSFNGFGMPITTDSYVSRIDLTHTQGGARQLSVQVSAAGGVRMCDREIRAPDPRACAESSKWRRHNAPAFRKPAAGTTGVSR